MEHSGLRTLSELNGGIRKIQEIYKHLKSERNIRNIQHDFQINNERINISITYKIILKNVSK